MDNREAVKWLTNISADIGKAEHSDLWHYDQALTEIKDMLEYAQLSQKGTTKDATSDTISRQAAIKAVNNAFDRETLLTGFVRSIAVRAIRDMPSAQPEEAIPVSWIEVKITQLISMDNEFAGLTAHIIKTLLNEWKKEEAEK